MKHVDVEKLVAEAVPVRRTFANRKEKLLHLAKVIRDSETNFVSLWHNVEAFSKKRLRQTRADAAEYSVLAYANRDPDFIADGIGDSMLDHMNYFQISQEELHQFSCDCGGAISGKDAARILHRLAHGKPPTSRFSGFFARMFSRPGPHPLS